MNVGCLSREQTTRFLAGEMSPAQEAKIARHLGQCAACHNLAETISNGAESRYLLVGSRAKEVTTTLNDSLLELQGRLQALPMYDEVDESESAAMSNTVTGGITQLIQPGQNHIESRQRLGKFEIIRQVGIGGFGVVYLAMDTALERLVALKLPRASMLADPDARHRFVREAKALARLDHPNIVAVFEAGECDGICYLAVEYCDGPTLDEWRRKQQSFVDPKIAARLLLALANAVEHAHQNGIYHRDIKPANVLLSESRRGDEVSVEPRLADFGLARIAEQEPSQSTMSGVVLGTPQYLAPEQAAGMTTRIGPQTDMYALGAILYELITGRPPIIGSTSIDTLRRVLVDEPIPARQVVSTVPEPLEIIAAKCLEKSTEFRYATARDLADDLGRFLDGRPIQAAICYNVRDGRSGRRARWPLVAASALIALITCTAVWATYSADRSPADASLPPSAHRAVAKARPNPSEERPQVSSSSANTPSLTGIVVPAHLARTEGNIANGAAFPFNLPVQNMSSMRYQQVYSRSEFDAPGTITAIRFRRDEAEPPFATAGIDIRVHLAYASGTVEELSPEFARNIGPERTAVLETTNLALSSQGMTVPRPFDIVIPFTHPFYYDPARGDLLLEIFSRNAILTGQFDSSCRGEQTTMRRVYAPAANASSGTLDLGVDTKPFGLVTRFDMLVDGQVETIGDRVTVAETPDDVETAQDLMAIRNYAAAEPLLRRAVAQSKVAMRSQDVANVEGLLGECMLGQKKFAEAEQHLLASYEPLHLRVNNNWPLVRTNCERLVQLYEAWGQAQQAAQWRTRWADVRSREIEGLSADMAERAVLLNRIALRLMKSGDFAAAEQPLRECLKMRTQALGREHRTTNDTENRIGECLGKMGRFVEGEELLLKTYSTLMQRSDVPLAQVAIYCQRLLTFYSDWGKPGEANRWRERWFEVMHEEVASLPTAPVERSRVLHRLGRTFLEQEQYRDAESLLRGYLAIREQISPQHWTTYNARIYLGASLAGQQKYEEAEGLVLSGYQALIAQRDQIDSANLRAPEFARDQLVQLYEQWDKPAEAQKWRAILESSPPRD
jgi:serine/threonine protein kinase/tetratricopeptide (TPR) repeat protein